jgi:hypothetical protein
MEADFVERLPDGNSSSPEGVLCRRLSERELSRSCSAHYRFSVANP